MAKNIIYSPNNYDTFIGINVDKNSFAFNVKDHFTMNKSLKIPAEQKNLNLFTQKFLIFLKKTFLFYQTQPFLSQNFIFSPIQKVLRLLLKPLYHALQGPFTPSGYHRDMNFISGCKFGHGACVWDIH